MSILADFPNFADVPKNLTNLTGWLYQALVQSNKKINARLDGLEARLGATQAEGQGSTSVSLSTDGVKVVDLNQYPVMGKIGRYTKLKSHFHTLGGEPSREACIEKLKAISEKVRGTGQLAAALNISKEEAIAWTYILKKRGWIKWSENPKGIVLTDDAPDNVHPR